MSNSLNSPVFRRFFIATILGAAFGVLCTWVASQGSPELFDVKNPIFWSIVTNRMLIGILVATAGAFTHHPLFKFRVHPILRGAKMGILASLCIAFVPAELLPEGLSALKVFWMTIGSGAVYGIIIDLVATKFGGEGKELLAGNK